MLPVYGANYMHRPPERPQTTGRANNQPRQLEFNEAMTDFKHMFPTLDRDVIEAVLRANNGLVDATIDQLLSMGIDMSGSMPPSSDSERPPLPSYSSLNQTEPPPAYTPRANKSSFSTSPSSRPLPATPYSAWNPPLLGKLPDDFLRLGPATTPVASSGNFGGGMDDIELERFLEDEKLAMVLQNEEFIRELRHNRDFMSSLEKDRQRSTATEENNVFTPVENTSTADKDSLGAAGGNNSAQQPSQLSASGSVSVEPVAVGATGGRPDSQTHEDAVLREKLRHMGKSTRKKFDKLAKMFHRKNVNRANIMASGSAVSTANLLEGYGDDDDDDEMLNAMGSARLEIMEERDDSKDRGTSPQKTVAPVKKPPETDPKKSGAVEPIVFFSEDNEFEYKKEQ